MARRRIALLVALVTGALLLPVDNAKACSCFRGDPRDQLADADGAIVGTFQESHPAVQPTPGLPTSSGDDTIYTFSVDEAIKGQFPDTLEVHSAADGATCGLEVSPGQDYGLFLYESEGQWHSNLCSQTSPDEMRDAATELPAPNGQGPPWLFVGGSFGEKQVISLDEKGRTIAYGEGGRDARIVETCPGGTHLAELGHSNEDARSHLMIRRTKTLDLISDIELPYFRGKRFGSQYPFSLSCIAKDGGKVIVFSTDQAMPAKSLFVLYTGQSREVLQEGSALAAEFHGDRAIVRDGKNAKSLALQELRPVRRTAIGRIPGTNPGPFAINAAGTKVAGISYPSYDRPDARPIAWLARLGTREILQRSPRGIDGTSQVLWWGKKVVMIPFFGHVTVLGPTLARKARFGDWHSNDAVVRGDVLYGVGDGVLIKAELPNGPVKTVRELPSPVTLSLSSAR